MVFALEISGLITDWSKKGQKYTGEIKVGKEDKTTLVKFNAFGKHYFIILRRKPQKLDEIRDRALF